jgi:hypothetical protein
MWGVMNRTPHFLAALLATVLLPACAASIDSESSESTHANSAADSAAIVWRGSSVTAHEGPLNSFVVATPSGTLEGDVELAAVATHANLTVTPPSGWALVTSQSDPTSTVGVGGVATSVYVHVAGASEPASVTFGLSASVRGVATIQSYRNVDPANPIDAVAGAAEATSRTSHTTPGLTTSVKGDVLVGIFATVNPHEPASTTSTMAHERVDFSVGNTGSWGLDLAVYDSAPRPSAGVEGGRAAISSSATDGAVMTLIALRAKTAAPAPTTLFGAAFNPHSADDFDALNAAFGGPMQVVRSYGDGSGGISSFASKFQALDTARNAASAFSFKILPTEVLAGQHDAEIRAFFNAIADNHPTYWTYWHEPDDELYSTHTFTASDYRAAWAHIRTIADSVKATRPALKAYATLIIMEYSMRPNIAPSRPLLGPNGMYPGDDVIEIFGVDAYNQSADQGEIADVAVKFGKVIDFAAAHGKPWAIGELGSCPVTGDPNGKATFLTNSIQYWLSRDSVPVYAAYFDLDKECNFRIDNEAPGRAVWHQAITEGIGSFE